MSGPPAGPTVFRLAGTLAFEPRPGFTGQNVRSSGASDFVGFNYTSPSFPFASRSCQTTRTLPAPLLFGGSPPGAVPFAVDLPVLDNINVASIFGLRMTLLVQYDLAGLPGPVSTRIGVTSTPTAVGPEPSTLALAASSVVLGGLCRRRQPLRG